MGRPARGQAGYGPVHGACLADEERIVSFTDEHWTRSPIARPVINSSSIVSLADKHRSALELEARCVRVTALCGGSQPRSTTSHRYIVLVSQASIELAVSPTCVIIILDVSSTRYAESLYNQQYTSVFHCFLCCIYNAD